MAMNKTRTIVWQALSWLSTVIHTHIADNGFHGHGIAVGKTDGDIPFAMEYDIKLEVDWNIKELSIKSLLDERVIKLVHKDNQWYDGSGQHLKEFDDVGFVDISISPFTNTLPIKRVDFKGKEPQKIDIIYFDENLFSLRRLQQIYSKIDERTYRYQDVELPDFIYDIVVDDDGLLVYFPKLFKQV
ncbi:putative glycolipid-binding domain-containing protein [Methanobacterium oryzae]|uniref:putative glycolipid-binding domain-containing protein n=1 Tax=Methanobacterium oryzae TaxID=69540 RepID=UPI003D2259E3